MSELTGIDLPYVERNTTRHGKMRFYFRFRGKRVARLPDDPNGEEFSRAYWAARRTAEAGAESVGPRPLHAIVRPNSFRWLCLQYMASPAFTALDPTTQTKRRKIMESMWAEPVDAGNIEVLRDRKRDTPFAADERLKILRQVFETKRAGRPIAPNVARSVKAFRMHSDGHHTITPDEIAAYIAHHGARSKAVLALALLMFTGFRISDLAQIGPQHRRRDEFRLRLFKNRNRAPTEIVVPIHPVLETVLSWHPVEGMTFLRTERGEAYTIKGLGNRVSDWFDQAGLPHCSAHTVRKGLATDQSENEATEKMLDAMFGWRAGKTSQIYTARADRSRLARQAVLKIRWDGVGDRLLASE